MAEDVYSGMAGGYANERKGGSSKKIFAVIIVAIAVVSIIGFAFYSGFFGTLFEGKITDENQAANTLSGIGNDIGGISEDLKDIENNL